MLQGKKAMITGAGHPQGIGFAIARNLAKHGAAVVITDVDANVLAQSKEELRKEGFEAYSSQFDVTDFEEAKKAIAQVQSEVGPIDILVNNVGGSYRISKEDMAFSHKDLKPQSFTGVVNIDTERWHQIINVNLHSAFYVSKLLMPSMMERRYGKIINMSSIAARQGASKDEKYTSAPYSVAKAGVIALTRQMALELAEYNINVNCIAPGLIMSARGQLAKDDLEPEIYDKIMQRIPLGRVGTVQDIAEIAYCLSSDMFSYVTGQTIDVNGGTFFS